MKHSNVINIKIAFYKLDNKIKNKKIFFWGSGWISLLKKIIDF